MKNDFLCPPKAIIFDMDGLLVDSERLWKKAETAMLADRGRVYDDHKHEPFIGMAMPEFLANIREVYELNDTVEALRVELIDRLKAIIAHETLPQPGALEIVDYVITQGIPYGIASSSPLAVIEATVGSQPAWEGAFKVRASADEVENGKPAPDVYLLAAERLGIDPIDCWAFEDSPNGARSAIAAGITCFAVPDPSHATPEKFKGVTPYVFDTLHDVLTKLKSC